MNQRAGMKNETVKRMLLHKLVVIIRVEDPEDIPPIVACMVESGVEAMEITSNTPGWRAAVSAMRQAYPDLLFGAGTILNVELAEQAIAAGAQFLVTPNTNADVVAHAHQHGIPVVMGAMTPTEVAEAMNAGADIVKLFPAGTLGTDYLKSLARGPYLDTVFFAVGGVDEHNLESWMENGAAGVDIGGSLAAPVPTEDDAEKLKIRISMIKKILSKTI